MRDCGHVVDVCVVGGGMAGMCAAIAAARQGARVALMHDRPVLGGNASSEIRMAISGAHGENNRETGIIDEIHAENLYRNPGRNYSVWDSILYEKVRFEPNIIALLLNCSCCGASMDSSHIESVRGWQTTTETWHEVRAKLFVDASGDSVLAPLTGAEFRIGREAASEFGESIAPADADRRTMGMSCLIQARETSRPRQFIPPAWAHQYPTCEDLPNRRHVIQGTNFWWIELGGNRDSIHDTEEIRDELLKCAFGVWDHIKNHCSQQDAARWVLDWVGFLPGKRESRRYMGDHIMTQNDVASEGRFDDLVAYGGWTMDDHHPDGFEHPGNPNVFHPAPTPYGIPYRSLYSRNIDNLFCAGRNISTTHSALSTTRVMATCALLGQAVGTAAAIATREGLTPRGVYESRIDELKQTLMDDDCYLPWNRRTISDLSLHAVLSAEHGNPAPLRNGIDRPIGAESNAWSGPIGSWIEYRFESTCRVTTVRLTFHGDLDPDNRNISSRHALDAPDVHVPETMIRAFRIETLNDDGSWRVAARIENNYQRLVRCPVNRMTGAVRLVPESTWGDPEARLFAFEVL